MVAENKKQVKSLKRGEPWKNVPSSQWSKKWRIADKRRIRWRQLDGSIRCEKRFVQVILFIHFKTEFVLPSRRALMNCSTVRGGFEINVGLSLLFRLLLLYRRGSWRGTLTRLYAALGPMRCSKERELEGWHDLGVRREDMEQVLIDEARFDWLMRNNTQERVYIYICLTLCKWSRRCFVDLNSLQSLKASHQVTLWYWSTTNHTFLFLEFWNATNTKCMTTFSDTGNIGQIVKGFKATRTSSISILFALIMSQK